MLIDTDTGTFYVTLCVILLVLLCTCSVGILCCVFISWLLASKLADGKLHRLLNNNRVGAALRDEHTDILKDSAYRSYAL